MCSHRTVPDQRQRARPSRAPEWHRDPPRLAQAGRGWEQPCTAKGLVCVAASRGVPLGLPTPRRCLKATSHSSSVLFTSWLALGLSPQASQLALQGGQLTPQSQSCSHRSSTLPGSVAVPGCCSGKAQGENSCHKAQGHCSKKYNEEFCPFPSLVGFSFYDLFFSGALGEARGSDKAAEISGTQRKAKLKTLWVLSTEWPGSVWTPAAQGQDTWAGREQAVGSCSLFSATQKGRAQSSLYLQSSIRCCLVGTAGLVF